MKRLNACNLCGYKFFDKSLTTKDFQTNSDKKYSLYRCKVCHLYQQNPVPSKENIELFYPKSYLGNHIEENLELKKDTISKIKNFLYFANRLIFMNYKKETKIIQEHRRKNRIKKLKILDVGCGSGHFLKSQLKFKYNLYGIDIDEQVIASLKKIYKINAKAVFFLDFETEEKFDVIFMSHFLEHTPDPKLTLEKAKSMLNENGMLLIKVPNIDSLNYYFTGKYSYFLDLPRHIFMFSPKTMVNYLEMCGFKNIKITTNIKPAFYISITNLLGLGRVRTFITKNFIFKLIYFLSTNLIENIFKILFLPFYLFFRGEEIEVRAYLK